MCEVDIPTRGFMQNLRFIFDVLTDKFASRSFTLVEKIVYSVLLFGRFISVSNIGACFFKKERAWSNFIDIYLMAWLAFLLFLLFKWPLLPQVVAVIAAYQIVTTLSNQLAVVLVDTQMKSWAQPSVRRGFILSLINLLSLVVSFAIILKSCGAISLWNGKEAVLADKPLQHLYFSFVTIATVGYGDFLPNGSTGYWLVIGEIVTILLFVVSIIPAFLGALSPSIGREYPSSRQHMTEDTHKSNAHENC